MSAWSSEELEQIGEAEELAIAPLRADGTPRRPVPIWVVRVGDELYVRSWRGPQGSWYRAARAVGQGCISAGSVEKAVAFEPADASLIEAVDDAYLAKYGRYPSYVEPMVSVPAQASTLRLIPQQAAR